MYRRTTGLRWIATLALGVLCTFGDAVWSQGQSGAGGRVRTAWLDGRPVVEGEVLVRYHDGVNALGRQRAEFDAEIDEAVRVGRRGTRRLRSRRLNTRALIERLQANPDVEFVEPNYILSIAAVPNEPWFTNLWGLFNTAQPVNGVSGLAGADINAPLAWDVTTGSRSSVIGVIDSGIDYNHEDLAANVWTAPRPFQVTIGGVVITCAAGTHGFNAITNTCDPFDDDSHGTHVAGTIGAVGNNGKGVAGVNWTASLMGLKFLDASGRGTTANAIEAIEFAIQAKTALGADANLRILSNSWGGGGFSQSLLNAIEAAAANDMLFVAAAGNEASNNDAIPMYPASYATSNMISVAATNSVDGRAWFSNWGAGSVHLGAPGQAILSTVPNNGYASYSGTSMATPQVAGAAALVLANCPMSTAMLRSTIFNTVDRVSTMQGITATGGRLNLNSAVRSCSFGPSLVTVTTPNVRPGGIIEVEVRNATARRMDWIGLYSANAPDTMFVDWQYLNGAQTAPAMGVATTTLQFVAPANLGTYSVRLFTKGYARVATSANIAVEPIPWVNINDVAVSEGDSGTRTATFTVSLSPPNATQTVLVSYATADGTAVAGSDYAATSGTLTFAPGTPSRTVSVTTFGDATIEPSETFSVTLSSPVNAVIGDGQGIATIATDDAPPPPALRLNATSIPPRPHGLFLLMVDNAPGNPRDWVGLYSITAPDTGFLDWFYLNGSKTAPVAGVANTSLVQLSPAAGYGQYEYRLFTNGYTKLATSPVLTVEPKPTLSINDITVTEGHSGTVNATFTVSLQPASTQVATAQWMTNNGTAASGSDYTAASGTLTFPPGSTAQSIVVAVHGDMAIEPSELFTVNLVGAANAFTSDSSGQATIINDDFPPAPPAASLTLAQTSVAPGGSFQVTVANAPGGSRDWVGVYQTGAADAAFADWYFLNGMKTAPTTGVVATTLTVPAPPAQGNYNVRLFTNGYTKLATSADIAVAAVSGPGPGITIMTPTVAPGGSIQVAISNGPAGARDWIGVYQPGAADGAFSEWIFLNGSKTAPATGLASGTVMVPAPLVPGVYHLRFFTNGYTLLATSATVTVPQ